MFPDPRPSHFGVSSSIQECLRRLLSSKTTLATVERPNIEAGHIAMLHGVKVVFSPSSPGFLIFFPFSFWKKDAVHALP